MARWDNGHLVPTDWEQSDGWHYCLVPVPNSHEWRITFLSMLKQGTTARYYEWSAGAAKIAAEIAGKAFGGIVFDENNDLTRIANALESIDSKMATRISYEQFISDLESALGTGHFAVAIVKGFFGAMPQLKVVVDYTEITMKVFEYFTFRAPILVMLGTMASSLLAIAISTCTGVVMAAAAGWQRLLQLETLPDVIFGITNPWQKLLDLLNISVPESEGGSASEEPDLSPDLHLQLSLDVTGRIANEIELICCDAASLGQETHNRVDGGENYEEEINESPIYPSPIGETLTYGSALVSQDRCNYAYWLVGAIQEMLLELYSRRSEASETVRTGGSLFYQVSTLVLGVFGFAALPFSGLLALTGAVWKMIAAYGDGWAERCLAGVAIIDINKDDIVCEILSMSGASAARGRMNSILVEVGVDKYGVAVISAAIPNHIFNGLFLEHPEIDIGDVTGDCSGCEGVPSVCSGSAVKDTRYAVEGYFNIGTDGLDVTLSAHTPNPPYGYGAAARFSVTEPYCARRLTQITIVSGSFAAPAYLALKDVTDTFFGSYEGAGSVTAANLASYNAYLAANIVLVHGFQFAYGVGDLSIKFDFEEA
jgi:hypothetical protein